LATATVEEVQLLKTLRWWDGFIIALCNPGFLLGSLGFTLNAFSVGAAMLLWATSAALGALQAFVYSEPATMFGHRSGGLPLYAHEGWRRYTTLVGPLSAFGYWIGWSVVLSIFGKVIGDLAVAQWWPHSSLSIGFLGNTLTLSSFIAIGCIIFVWAFNIIGRRAAVWFTYVCAVLLMVPLVLFVIVPLIAKPPAASVAFFAGLVVPTVKSVAVPKPAAPLLPFRGQLGIGEVDADHPSGAQPPRPLLGEHPLAAADVEHRGRRRVREQVVERALEARHQPPHHGVGGAVLVEGVAGGDSRPGGGHTSRALRSSASAPAPPPCVGGCPGS